MRAHARVPEVNIDLPLAILELLYAPGCTDRAYAY
jgi:hypothetical protein